MKRLRDDTPNFPRTDATWCFTVASLLARVVAISLFESPCMTWAATSRSAGVSNDNSEHDSLLDPRGTGVAIECLAEPEPGEGWSAGVSKERSEVRSSGETGVAQDMLAMVGRLLGVTSGCRATAAFI